MRSEVEEASRQEVRVGVGRGGGGVLPSLPLVLLAILFQGQQGERNHATSQRGELRLSALAVVLPGFVSRDGVWREEERNKEKRESEQVNSGQGRRERKDIFNPWLTRVLHVR